MRRRSWLDSIVYRFQHHWETSPQYRAAVSGVVGLVLILSLCTCMGVLNSTASLALAAVGFGSGGAGPLGTPNTGTNKVGCCNSFPTPTVLYPTNGPNPVATMPQSQTPPPFATATESPTPTDTPDPGNGGGNGGACSGGPAGASWSFDPCPASRGQDVTFTVNAPGYGGHTLIIEVSFGQCINQDGCQILYPSGTPIPANGVWSMTLHLPMDTTGPVAGSYSISGGPANVVVTGKSLK